MYRQIQKKLGWLFMCRLKPWESISKPCFCVKNVFILKSMLAWDGVVDDVTQHPPMHHPMEVIGLVINDQ
jgi:hypothetical protein